MGEALITRRGGGSVMTGAVSNVQEFVMSDQALVGVKNVVIQMRVGGYTHNDSTVAYITIVRGEITSFMTYSDAGAASVGTNINNEFSFDKTTGTITCNVYNTRYRYTFFKGKTTVSVAEAAEYNYIIFD